MQIEVLDTLQDYRWLNEMLKCFHNGDLHKYDELCIKHRGVLNSQPALTENVHQLRQKITILCLMELIFRWYPMQAACHEACMHVLVLFVTVPFAMQASISDWTTRRLCMCCSLALGFSDIAYSCMFCMHRTLAVPAICAYTYIMQHTRCVMS